MVSGRSRRGIALPLVLLVLIALGLLSSLALFEALQATRAARLAEDEVRARAIAIAGVERLLSPPDLPWLCLQPPAAPLALTDTYEREGRVHLRWWSLGGGRVRGEVLGVGRGGGRHRRLALLVADSVPLDVMTPGCPGARGLRPDRAPWLSAHPDG
jgi:hypothetical protein